jgi:hypothetical protein
MERKENDCFSSSQLFEGTFSPFAISDDNLEKKDQHPRNETGLKA